MIGTLNWAEHIGDDTQMMPVASLTGAAGFLRSSFARVGKRQARLIVLAYR